MNVIPYYRNRMLYLFTTMNVIPYYRNRMLYLFTNNECYSVLQK